MAHNFDSSDLAACAIALIAALGFILLGGPVALGAHPWWATKAGMSGAGIGITLWLALRLARVARTALFWLSGFILLVGVAMAWIGKMRFVASYGDDILAGRSWLFGWAVLMAGAFMVIAAAWGRESSKHSDNEG